MGIERIIREKSVDGSNSENRLVTEKTRQHVSVIDSVGCELGVKAPFKNASDYIAFDRKESMEPLNTLTLVPDAAGKIANKVSQIPGMNGYQLIGARVIADGIDEYCNQLATPDAMRDILVLFYVNAVKYLPVQYELKSSFRPNAVVNNHATRRG